MSRHRLRRLLGVLWLTAAALQAQPGLFTATFPREVIGPVGLFQPAVVSGPVRLAVRVVGAHPGGWNGVFVLVELALGLALLFARQVSWTGSVCAASSLWALSVWWVGEGAGGLFTGHAALSTGAPGAALLYAVLSLVAAPSRRAAGILHEPVSRRAVALVWAAVWVLGAALDLRPGQSVGHALGDQVAMGSMMSPDAFARPELSLARWLAVRPDLGAALVVALAVLFVVVGLAPLLGAHPGRLAVAAGLALSVVFWVLGQGFGGLSTGTATDVGAAPVVALLGFTILRTECRPAYRRRRADAGPRRSRVPVSGTGVGTAS